MPYLKQLVVHFHHEVKAFMDLRSFRVVHLICDLKGISITEFHVCDCGAIPNETLQNDRRDDHRDRRKHQEPTKV